MKIFGTNFSPGIARVALVLGVLALMVSFHLAYVSWLLPVYGYLGFLYPSDLGRLTVIGYLFGIVPAFWMPIALNRPSQFLHWAIYLTIYAPAMLVLGFVQLRPDREIITLQIVLLLGLVTIGLSYQLKLPQLVKPRISPFTFWSLFGLTTLALFGRVVLVYWGNFQFVSWKEAYDIRYSGSDIATAAGLAYPINWLSFVFLPVVMAVGLLSRRHWLFALAVAGSVLLFATQGMKHILFSGPYLVVMFLLLRRKPETFGLRFVWGNALLLFVFALYVTTFDAAWSGPAMLIGANFVLRIFGNNGLLMAAYQNFFAEHVPTYYSHVTGVNWFVSYPYAHPLGIEVSLAAGAAAGSDTFNNQNAGFWPTDGLGAIGLPGVIVISLLIALVFYCLDSVSASHKTSLVALFLSQYVLILINVSFFTSLITGGLVFFFLIFYFMPAHRVNQAKPLPSVVHS